MSNCKITFNNEKYNLDILSCSLIGAISIVTMLVIPFILLYIVCFLEVYIIHQLYQKFNVNVSDLYQNTLALCLLIMCITTKKTKNGGYVFELQSTGTFFACIGALIWTYYSNKI